MSCHLDKGLFCLEHLSKHPDGNGTFNRGINSVSVLHEVPLQETEPVFQNLWLELANKF